MVEFSPATREVRVRFPADAFLNFNFHLLIELVISNYSVARSFNDHVHSQSFLVS